MANGHAGLPGVVIPREPCLEFNVNSTVLVRLTERGRSILFKQRAEFFEQHGTHGYRDPVEIDGWSEWQLWELAQRLGGHMGNGMGLVIETTIRIPERNLK